MPKYRIFAGLSGGFNSVCQQAVEEHFDLTRAEDSAYEYAISEYDQYDGMHGLMSWEEARKEAELQFSTGDEDDDDYDNEIEAVAEEIYNDIRESWLEYWAEEVTDEELAILPIKEVED